MRAVVEKGGRFAHPDAAFCLEHHDGAIVVATPGGREAAQRVFAAEQVDQATPVEGLDVPASPCDRRDPPSMILQQRFEVEDDAAQVFELRERPIERCIGKIVKGRKQDTGERSSQVAQARGVHAFAASTGSIQFACLIAAT